MDDARPTVSARRGASETAGRRDEACPLQKSTRADDAGLTPGLPLLERRPRISFDLERAEESAPLLHATSRSRVELASVPQPRGPPGALPART